MKQETLSGPGASWIESRLGFENLGTVFFQGTLEQEEQRSQQEPESFRHMRTGTLGNNLEAKCLDLSCVGSFAGRCNVGSIVALSLLDASGAPKPYDLNILAHLQTDECLTAAGEADCTS